MTCPHRRARGEGGGGGGGRRRLIPIGLDRRNRINFRLAVLHADRPSASLPVTLGAIDGLSGWSADALIGNIVNGLSGMVSQGCCERDWDDCHKLRAPHFPAIF